jgi:hypothetical protein
MLRSSPPGHSSKRLLWLQILIKDRLGKGIHRVDLILADGIENRLLALDVVVQRAAAEAESTTELSNAVPW